LAARRLVSRRSSAAHYQFVNLFSHTMTSNSDGAWSRPGRHISLVSESPSCRRNRRDDRSSVYSDRQSTSEIADKFPPTAPLRDYPFIVGLSCDVRNTENFVLSVARCPAPVCFRLRSGALFDTQRCDHGSAMSLHYTVLSSSDCSSNTV